jgi:enterochelin esterase-like enzyme
VHFEVHSRLLDTTLEEIGLVPAPLGSGGRRPLLLFLHGRGSSPTRLLEQDGLIPALEGLRAAAPIVILVDGGDASYYHDRGSGPWASYVMRDVLLAGVRRFDADPGRVAIGGESMGGFGALNLARLWPTRFCAVGAHSAALWREAAQTPAGAFDDAEDFARHDLFAFAAGNTPVYSGEPVWMDVGSADPFRAADDPFAQLLREAGVDVSFRVWLGGHNDAYWRSHMTSYLSFYARSLAACG